MAILRRFPTGLRRLDARPVPARMPWTRCWPGAAACRRRRLAARPRSTRTRSRLCRRFPYTSSGNSGPNTAPGSARMAATKRWPPSTSERSGDVSRQIVVDQTPARRVKHQHVIPNTRGWRNCPSRRLRHSLARGIPADRMANAGQHHVVAAPQVERRPTPYPACPAWPAARSGPRPDRAAIAGERQKYSAAR